MLGVCSPSAQGGVRLDALGSLGSFRKSGIGLPHSTTSRTKRHAVIRASPASAGECGSPMPPLTKLYRLPITFSRTLESLVLAFSSQRNCPVRVGLFAQRQINSRD